MEFTKHRLGIIEGIVIIFICGITIFAILRFVLEPQVIEEKYELLIDLLGITLAYAGIIAGILGAVVYKFIEQKITEKDDKERNFSRYETNLNQGYSLWNLFHEKDILFHENDMQTLNREAIEELKEMKEDLINRAIGFTRRSLESISKLNEKQYEENLCWCKNNLVYYLAEKTKRYETMENDEKEAMCWGNEIYQAAKTKGVNYKESYRWKESYAWVLWWFGKEDKNNKRRKNALNIIKELQQDLKTKKEEEWYKRITKKYIKLIKQEKIKNPSLFEEELDELEDILKFL